MQRGLRSGCPLPAIPLHRPELRLPRQQRDADLLPEIERVGTSNVRVYGADKVCKQLRREVFNRGRGPKLRASGGLELER